MTDIHFHKIVFCAWKNSESKIQILSKNDLGGASSEATLTNKKHGGGNYTCVSVGLYGEDSSNATKLSFSAST